MMIWKKSEVIQSELSSIIAWLKHLMQQFQALIYSPCSSSTSQISQTNRSSSMTSLELLPCRHLHRFLELNYLTSQLCGEASLLIVTSDSYNHSVVLLQDWYSQTQELITAHMQALLDLPNPSNVPIKSTVILWCYRNTHVKVVYTGKICGFLWRPARPSLTNYHKKPQRVWWGIMTAMSGIWGTFKEPYKRKFRCLK